MVLGVNYFESENTVINFAQQFGITFPLLLDGEVYSQYSQPGGQSPFPLDYIIDRFGEIAYWNNEYDPLRIQEVIDSLLNPTVIEDTANNQLPSELQLMENYPNPFNASTTISYTLPYPSEVTLDIYDILGRKVETLVSMFQTAGSHSISWNADGYSSGVYFYKITAGEFMQIQKMTLIK